MGASGGEKGLTAPMACSKASLGVADFISIREIEDVDVIRIGTICQSHMRCPRGHVSGDGPCEAPLAHLLHHCRKVTSRCLIENPDLVPVDQPAQLGLRMNDNWLGQAVQFAFLPLAIFGE